MGALGRWAAGAAGGTGGGRPWGRARRGDVRSAILALLAERPMHGYEIIAELSERTEGLWRPSPGSIYPTLQLLEDEGLISVQSDDAGGKKRFSLTEEGQQAAAEVAKGQAPWEQVAAGAPAGARALRHAMGRLMPVVGQVAMSRRSPGVRGSRQDPRRGSPAALRRTGRRPGPGDLLRPARGPTGGLAGLVTSNHPPIAVPAYRSAGQPKAGRPGIVQPERRPCSRASMISGPGTKSPSGGRSSVLSRPRRSSNIELVP